jgi:hypothetical protein
VHFYLDLFCLKINKTNVDIVMQKKRTYFYIDMKSFFAFVECAKRGLNPFETNLVVATLQEALVLFVLQ